MSTALLNSSRDSTPRRSAGCRYSDPRAGLCGNESVDPEGALLLCPRHAGLAMELLAAPLQALMRASV